MRKTANYSLVHTWLSFLHGNILPGDPTMAVLDVTMWVSFIGMAIFGLLQLLVAGNTLIGQLGLACATAIAVNIIGLQLSQNITLARTYFLLTLIALLLVLFITGGIQGSGIFWFFIFPLIAFFLTGKKQGILWLGALYLAVLSILFMSLQGIVYIPYAPMTVMQVLLSLAVVSFIIYVYQAAHDTAQQAVNGVDSAKNQLIALASHQLRTPISAISWFSEMLISGDSGKLTKEQRQSIEHIYNSNQRMAALISDMLMVANLDLKNVPVKPAPTDITSLAQHVMKDLHQGLMAGRRLQITDHYAANLPHVPLDHDIIRTILHNLLSNAIKYTPDGGTISLRIARNRTKLARNSKGCLVIEVQDTGYGIPVSEQGKLFSKFFRGKNILDKDTDGAGLGLFIVKELLDYIGGTIVFTSAEDAGSTFTVQLPLEGMAATKDPRDDKAS